VEEGGISLAERKSGLLMTGLGMQPASRNGPKETWKDRRLLLLLTLDRVHRTRRATRKPFLPASFQQGRTEQRKYALSIQPLQLQ
jgi:hypothetical protein